jgi:hypothetical protein
MTYARPLLPAACGGGEKRAGRKVSRALSWPLNLKHSPASGEDEEEFKIRARHMGIRIV